MYAEIECQGRWQGPLESPTAFETNKFGWVLGGCTGAETTCGSITSSVTSYHSSVTSYHSTVFEAKDTVLLEYRGTT